MRLPLTFNWLIELQPPLPFIFLIAFQTFCVCVLEFNLLQKCLHEFLFCCLTTWRALALKSLKFWTLLSVGLEKNFRWAFFPFLTCFFATVIKPWNFRKFFSRSVFLVYSPWARYRNPLPPPLPAPPPPPPPPPGGVDFWRKLFLDSSVCVFSVSACLQDELLCF